MKEELSANAYKQLHDNEVICYMNECFTGFAQKLVWSQVNNTLKDSLSVLVVSTCQVIILIAGCKAVRLVITELFAAYQWHIFSQMPDHSSFSSFLLIVVVTLPLFTTFILAQIS